MAAWLKRFGLHMAAAIGATGIFVAAAAVGANQTRQQGAAIATQEALTVTSEGTSGARRKPSVVITATPVPASAATESAPAPTSAQPAPSQMPPASAAAQPSSAAAPPRRTLTPVPAPATSSGASPTPEKVVPERSLAGSITDVHPDSIDVLGVGGREWRVVPAPGALIRLNGKAARVDGLQVGDTVVILGQAQAGKDGSLSRFLAHAITARRK